MRLSMDEVRKQHDGIKKLYEQGLRGATASVEQVLDLFDTIEALQQENKQLKKERDQAIRDIDKGNCRSCVYDSKKICYGNMHGKDREVAKEQGLPYCIGWQAGRLTMARIGGNHVDDELKERARIEQAIRDLQLYIDVK